MKVELLEWQKKKRSMHILVKGFNDYFVNLIRRYAMDEVPTLAVEEVEFKENSSGLYDEMVAHRLGLIPIKTDLTSYRLPENVQEIEEKSARCTLQLTLKSAKKGIVTAQECKSADPKCTFVYEDMPVVKLLAHQKLDVVMTAVMGVGREHAKWSPGIIYFKKEAKVKTDSIKADDQTKKRVQAVCGKIVSFEGSKVKVNTDKLYVESSFDACLGVLEEAGAKVEDTDNFIMTIEGWGQVTEKEMLKQACDVVVNRIEEIEKQV